MCKFQVESSKKRKKKIKINNQFYKQKFLKLKTKLKLYTPSSLTYVALLRIPLKLNTEQ